MKKTTLLISGIAAMTVSTILSSMAVNCMAESSDSDMDWCSAYLSSDMYDKALADFTEFNDYGILERVASDGDEYQTYYKKVPQQTVNGQVRPAHTSIEFVRHQCCKDEVYFFIKEEDYSEKTMQSILSALPEKFEVSSGTQEHDETLYYWYKITAERSLSNESIAEILKLRDELESKAMPASFNYYKEPRMLCGDNIYFNIDEVMFGDINDIDNDCNGDIKNYLNSIDVEYVFNTEKNTFDFNDEKYSVEEQMKILSDIDNNLGYKVLFDITELGLPVYATKIDLLNSKFGDVDGDSELTAMDASYVLMHYSDVQTGVEIDTNTSDYANMTIFGDYNGDGTVDALDASEILTVYAENQTK